MKRVQALSIAVLLMAWPGDASDHNRAERREKVLRTPFRHAITDTVRSGLSTRSKESISSTAHADDAVSRISGKRIKLGEMQRDQHRPSDRGRRRLHVKRREEQFGNSGQLEIFQDEAAPSGRTKQPQVPGGGRLPSLLASFAGKHRVMVISAPHGSDNYYRMIMSLLKSDVYCELAERHVLQVVIFHQEGEMGGKVRRITTEGRILEEPLDTALIPQLMNHLKLEKGKFGMVLLRKTMQVEEHYPYPVRLEALYEVIDQAPMRRIEKVRQKDFVKKCKEAGVEGQVVGTSTSNSPESQVDKSTEKKSVLRRIQLGPTKVAVARVTTKTTTATTTTTSPTTTLATTTTSPTTALWTTIHPTTTLMPTTTQNPTTAYPTYVFDYYTKAYTFQNGDRQKNKKDYSNENVDLTVTKPKSKSSKPSQTPSPGTVISNEYDSDRENSVTTGPTGDSEVVRAKPGKIKQDKTEKNKKKKSDNVEKGGKREKIEKKPKKPKDGKGKGHNKKTEKVAKNQKLDEPTTFKGALNSFMDYFESRRRLIVITSPSEEHGMYVQQRDEYLEHVCDMAIRKLSIITIFGTLTNSTMKIDHYQLEHDRSMKGLRKGELMNQDLIIELRNKFGMTDNEFFMVLTDFDMKVKQYYEVPIAMKAVFDYIDTFASRIKEMEDQRREGLTCKKEDKPRSLEHFLSRFRWRRRLLIISSPGDEEYGYTSQLQALSSQGCNLGLRHVSVLKLLGVNSEDMGGVLELYAINGNATVEREGLSMSLVKDIRNYFQISPEYFAMLLVGKDGNVKSWYPSPMWSMAILYDLVDSMQLRRHEMAIQQSLGMRCPEEDHGAYGYHNQGYHDGYHVGLHHGYGY